MAAVLPAPGNPLVGWGWPWAQPMPGCVEAVSPAERGSKAHCWDSGRDKTVSCAHCLARQLCEWLSGVKLEAPSHLALHLPVSWETVSQSCLGVALCLVGSRLSEL